MELTWLLLAFSGVGLLSIGVLSHFTKNPVMIFIPAGVTAFLLILASVFSLIAEQEYVKGLLLVAASILCGLFLLLLLLPPFRK